MPSFVVFKGKKASFISRRFGTGDNSNLDKMPSTQESLPKITGTAIHTSVKMTAWFATKPQFLLACDTSQADAMATNLRNFLLLFTTLMLQSPASRAGEPITEQEFIDLHRNIVPTQELWKTIPWHTDLISGQQQAALENKLLFIWSMDGHPLGCT